MAGRDATDPELLVALWLYGLGVSGLNKEIQVYGIPSTRIAEVLGKRMVQNSVMVGLFTAVTHLLDPDAVGSGRRFCPSKLSRIEPEGF